MGVSTQIGTGEEENVEVVAFVLSCDEDSSRADSGALDRVEADGGSRGRRLGLVRVSVGVVGVWGRRRSVADEMGRRESNVDEFESRWRSSWSSESSVAWSSVGEVKSNT